MNGLEGLIEIGNFSTLFEIAAALNMAYIAVEYSTSYTLSLAKNIFKFDEQIENGKGICTRHIDEETINSLKSTTVGGKSTMPKIEQAKRKSSVLKRKIETLEKDMIADVSRICQTHVFSSLCLYLFLYCVVASVTSAYKGSLFPYVFWLSFFVLSIVYTITLFFRGEIRLCKMKYMGGIRSNTVFLFAIIVLSLAFSLFTGANDMSQCPSGFMRGWNIIAPVSALYPFVFFILFVFLLNKKSKETRTRIKTESENLEKECIDLEKKVELLLGMSNFALSDNDSSSVKKQGTLQKQFGRNNRDCRRKRSQ